MKKIAVLGYGVVGSGTVEILYNHKESIEKKIGESYEVKYILDLRDFPDSPYADKFTKSFDDIVNDKEVDIVVEVLGGVKFAYPYVKASLEAGKSVVTSNKALVADKAPELFEAVDRRCEKYPLQYIIGEWYFYGERNKINENCLIPRSDTEMLVEYAIKNLPKNYKLKAIRFVAMKNR